VNQLGEVRSLFKLHNKYKLYYNNEEAKS